jgi:hypothetical protein
MLENLFFSKDRVPSFFSSDESYSEKKHQTLPINYRNHAHCRVLLFSQIISPADDLPLAKFLEIPPPAVK